MRCYAVDAGTVLSLGDEMTRCDRLLAAVRDAGEAGITVYGLCAVLGLARENVNSTIEQALKRKGCHQVLRGKVAAEYFAQQEWAAAAGARWQIENAETKRRNRQLSIARKRQRRAVLRAQRRTGPRTAPRRYSWPAHAAPESDLGWHVGAELQRVWTVQP